MISRKVWKNKHVNLHMLPVSCPLRTCFSHRYVVRSSSWLPLYQSSITSSYCSIKTSHWHTRTNDTSGLDSAKIWYWNLQILTCCGILCHVSDCWEHLFFKVGHFCWCFIPQLIGDVHHHVHSLIHQTMEGGEGLWHALHSHMEDRTMQIILEHLNFSATVDQSKSKCFFVLFCCTRAITWGNFLF